MRYSNYYEHFDGRRTSERNGRGDAGAARKGFPDVILQAVDERARTAVEPKRVTEFSTSRKPRFVPACEVIFRKRGRREISWLKPTHWRGLPECDSLISPYCDPPKNAERIKRESTIYLPYYDHKRTGPIPVEAFAVRSGAKQREIEGYFRDYLPHRAAVSKSFLTTLHFVYEGGGPEPLIVQRARLAPELLSEACYLLVRLVDGWVDRPDSAFDKPGFFMGILKRRLINFFKGEAKHVFSEVKCLNCEGQGYVGPDKCKVCRGRGFLYLSRVGPIEGFIPSEEDEPTIREPIDPQEGPEERLLSSTARAAVRAEVDRLPDFQRNLMHALFWDDLKEIPAGRALSKSQPTVNRAKKSALKSLCGSPLRSILGSRLSTAPDRRVSDVIDHNTARRALLDWWGEMKARNRSDRRVLANPFFRSIWFISARE